MKKAITAAASAAVILSAAAALAATIPDACQTVKQKRAGILAICLHTAQSKYIVTGNTAALNTAVTKCTTTFSDKWTAAEQKAIAKGGACSTTGDEAEVTASINANVACITSALETGHRACLVCGNGVLDSGEGCDFGTMGTATCENQTEGTEPLGTLDCSPGCTLDTSGCTDRVVVGGFTWFLGADGASCDTTCAAKGLSTAAATTTYAGSDGTDAHCIAVFSAMGVSEPFGTTNTGSGLGCATGMGFVVRDTSPTQNGSGFPGVRRACACQ